LIAQARSGVVLLVVDDLHWVDPPSAAVLLFALRRLEADRVLALVSTRPGEVSVAAGWERFVSGDPRVSRIRLPGIDADDVRELAEQLGGGSPSTAVASRLVAHTGGSPLHCRALLEELGAEGLRRAGDVRLPVTGLEQRLLGLWDACDARDARTAARIAPTMMAYLHISARVEGAADWATRALVAADGDSRLTWLCRPWAAWGVTWLRGRDGLQGFDYLPSDPSAVPLELSDDLWVRGQARSGCDDLHGAIADLRTVATRVRAGVPIRYPSQSLAFMCDTEYRLGRWDDALLHGELAVSLSRDAERVWDYPFVHAYATFVPAARGDWELASMHADAATAATEQFDAATAVVVTATARAALSDARGNHAAVLEAAADIRSTGRIAVFAPGIWDWQHLEIDALISTGRYDRAGRAGQALPVDRAARGARVAGERRRSAWAAGGGRGPPCDG
jgi:hypothetical protein